MKKKVTKSEEEWKKELTPEQYEVTRKKRTERAFTGEYYNSKEPGVYRCVACGNPLFSSKTKYESGSGWPSFWEPISAEGIRTEEDQSHGMRRVEVLCASCESHLGHLFPDGPRPTGMRYCINSASLKLEKEKQEEEKKR
ncbi:MAG: peptide-methionine (R)-S-oxide reductase MsrB [Candidatus Manganitrophus sp. SB1]|nr:peptide-methionine (R)-S-oxide reductase MsrB [Candidatus Manganitrophus morganii]